MAKMLEIKGAEVAIDRMYSVMKQAAKEGGHLISTVGQHQAKNIAINLQKICQRVAPNDAFYEQLPSVRKWQIGGRKNGMAIPKKFLGKNHVHDEIEFRKKHKFYLASGWANCVRSLMGKDLKPSANAKRGIVEVDTSGITLRISIINPLDFAKQLHDKYGIVKLALNATTRDMITYIRLKQGAAVQKCLRAQKLYYKSINHGD